MSVRVTITASGRMSLPADMRRRMGLSRGGDVLLEETADGVVLRTLDQAIAQAQAMARAYGGDDPQGSVDAFLAERRIDGRD